MTRRESRRLTLVARQLTLARIARREALAAMAEALGEEEKAREVKRRSERIANAHAGARGNACGATLAGRIRFACALSDLARRASIRVDEAAREAEWRARALGEAERRLERLEAREADLRREAEAARERRSAPVLARNLQRLKSHHAKD